jgi:FixJ family two-component response regulator
MTSDTTVFIVDDDEAVRCSLRSLLGTVALPTREFASAEAFLMAYDPNWCGCLLLDVRMPGMDGLQLLEELPRRGIFLPTIILTGHADVPMAVRALEAGAAAFLEKPFRAQDLLERLERVLQRERETRQEQAQHRETAHRLASLTPGERAVLDRLVAGKPYKTIARELAISYKTVEARSERIRTKMQVDGLAELLHRVVGYNFWLAAQTAGRQGDPGRDFPGRG